MIIEEYLKLGFKKESIKWDDVGYEYSIDVFGKKKELLFSLSTSEYYSKRLTVTVLLPSKRKYIEIISRDSNIDKVKKALKIKDVSFFKRFCLD